MTLGAASLKDPPVKAKGYVEHDNDVRLSEESKDLRPCSR